MISLMLNVLHRSLLMINDLPNVKCVTQIFADDDKVFSTIKSKDDLHKFQTDVDQSCGLVSKIADQV